MAESSRKRRYFGMTIVQVGLLSILAAINCVVLGVGAALILIPPSSGTVAVVNQRPTLPPTAAQPSIAAPQPTQAFFPTPNSTATATPEVGPGQIAQLETLDSYRLQGRMVMEGGQFLGSTTITWSFTQEWVKTSLAQHTITSIESTMPISSTDTPYPNPPTTIETIVIGNTSWIKMGNDWTRIDYQQPQYQRSSVGNLESEWRSRKPVGEETINNIPCIHYKIDEDTMKMSGPNGDMTTHAEGDIWVANQPDLPAVIVRAQIHMQVKGSFFSLPTAMPVPSPEAQTSQIMGYYYEYELTDVNTSINIEPPQTTRVP